MEKHAEESKKRWEENLKRLNTEKEKKEAERRERLEGAKKEARRKKLQEAE